MKNLITIFIMLVAVGCGKSNSITEDEENGILKTTVGVLSNVVKRLEAENENLKEEINKLKEKGGKEDESIEPVKKLTAEEKKLLAVMKERQDKGSNLPFLKMENQRNGLMVRSWRMKLGKLLGMKFTLAASPSTAFHVFTKLK